MIRLFQPLSPIAVESYTHKTPPPAFTTDTEDHDSFCYKSVGQLVAGGTKSYDRLSTIVPVTSSTKSIPTTDNIYNAASFCRSINIPAGFEGLVPFGAGIHFYDIAPARAQSGYWLSTTSILRGDQSSLRLNNIPAVFMEENWPRIADTLTGSHFWIQLGNSRYIAMAWLDSHLTEPTLNSAGHYTFNFDIKA